MDKPEFIKKMKEYGDAAVTYISPQSRKEKFSICTIDFSTPYIAKRPGLVKVDPQRVLVFCWDENKYKQIDYRAVIKVDPLNQMIERARSVGRTYTKYGSA